jgi:hypothetical protein
LLIYKQSFNLPLPWDVASVEDFSYAFAGALSFNQDLTWNTSAAITMKGMFSGALSFNGDVNVFDIDQVVDLSETVRPLFCLFYSIGVVLWWNQRGG